MVSSALFGMMFGAMFLGTIADKIGRRWAIVICIVLFSVFTAAAGMTHDPVTFSITRFLAGLGIGGVMPNVVAQMTEYSPRKMRSTLVTLMFSGYSVGGMLAAVLGKGLIETYGWSYVFYAAAVPVLIIPFVLMMTFSKLLVSDIKMSVEVAMLLSVFIGMLCELLRTRSVRTAFAGLSSFLDGMGKVFGPVVALIVCAELFAESLKAIGAIDTLLHSASNAGIGSGLMTLVMVGLIMVAAVIMGSGNAAFLSFSSLAPAVAAKFGVPAVTMLLPMQLASSIGRTVSPIAAVLIACAGIAKVSPFVVVKRTSVPMAGALVTALLLNYLLFM